MTEFDKKTITNENPDMPEVTAGGCLCRFFWMMFGNCLLIISAVFIIRHGRGFSTADFIYWLSVVMLAIARYQDITRYQGTDVLGKSATMRIWWCYTALLVAISSVIWAIAHLVVRYYV